MDYNWEEEIMKKELEKIFGDIIELEDNTQVSCDRFDEMFSDAEKLTYNELIRVEENENYGYAEYIEKWKKEGLIE